MVWSMTLEFLARLVTLDVSWLFDLIGKNLFWLFVFAALGFVVYGHRKNLVFAFAFIVLVAWVSTDFTRAVGWTFQDPRFWTLNMILQISILMFAESDEKLKKHFVFLNTMRFVFVLSFFNMFLR